MRLRETIGVKEKEIKKRERKEIRKEWAREKERKMAKEKARREVRAVGTIGRQAATPPQTEAIHPIAIRISFAHSSSGRECLFAFRREEEAIAADTWSNEQRTCGSLLHVGMEP